MGSQNLVVYPKDLRYRLPAGMVVKIIHLLQQEGVIGGPLTAYPSHVEWRPGLRLGDKLGFQHRDGWGHIEIEVSDKLAMHCATDFETACPTCGGEVEDSQWSSQMNTLFGTEEEVSYVCSCGAATTLTALRYNPSVAFEYFAIHFVNLGNDIDMGKPLWADLEQVLGTELSVARYKL
jgi:hypothetical protein